MVSKLVDGTSVSTNIQEFWFSNSALNLDDTDALNVGSSVKISYKSRYVKRWTSTRPTKVDKHSDHLELIAMIRSCHRNIIEIKTEIY